MMTQRQHNLWLLVLGILIVVLVLGGFASVYADTRTYTEWYPIMMDADSGSYRLYDAAFNELDSGAVNSTSLSNDTVYFQVSYEDTAWNQIWVWVFYSADSGLASPYDITLAPIPTRPVDTIYADMLEVSGDATAADNLENAFDGGGATGVSFELEHFTVTTSSGNAVSFTSTDGDALQCAGSTDDIDADLSGSVDTVTTNVGLADNYITSSKLADNCIGGTEIAAGAIGASEIADGAIDAGAISADAITNAKIADDAIGATEIATGAVDSDALAQNAVQEIWQLDSSLAVTVGSMGKLLRDSLSYLVTQIANILTDVTGLDGWTPHLDNDSLVVDLSSLANRPAIGDTIQRAASTFDPASDSVMVDGSAFAATTDAITSTTIAASAIASSEIANAAITTSAFAVGAINSNVLDDDAITASKLAANAITSSELASTAVDEIWEYDSSNVAAGMGEMIKDTSAYQGAAGSVTLASIYDTVATAINDSCATTASLVDGVWDEAQSGHTTDGTFGAHLDDTVSGISGGSGSDTTAILALIENHPDLFVHLIDSIADVVWDEDTTSHATAGTFGEQNNGQGWASASDLKAAVWGSDSTDVDTSAVGAWLENNAGGAAASNWSNAQRDTLIARVLAILDTVNSYDGWIAQQTTATSNTTTLSAILDTLLLNQDSLQSLASWVAQEATFPSNFADLAVTATTGMVTVGTSNDKTGYTLTNAEKGLIGDSTYNVFTSGSNEDQFKATGFSTFDAASDKVTVVDTTAADVSYVANTPTAFKATGFSTHSAGDVYTELAQHSFVSADTNASGEELALMPDHWLGADSIAYQGGAAGLDSAAVYAAAVDALTNTTVVPTDTNASGYDIALMPDHWLGADSIAYQGDAASVTVAGIIDSMLKMEPADTSTGSILSKLLTGADVESSDTVSIKAMLAGNPNIVKATGFSSHTPTDVYTYFTSGSNEDQFKSTGFATHTAADVYSEFTSGSNEDAFKSTGFATHTAADVYAQFIAGVNEQAFWLSDSVQQVMAGLAADSAGSITASIDSADVANYVWNSVASGFTGTGSFGSYLDQKVSAVVGLSGSGAYTITTLMVDTSATTDSVVTGTVMFVNNQAQNATPYRATTDNNGEAVFNLDAGTWVRFTTEPGFGVVVDTFTVSTTVTDTLMLYRDNGNRTTVAWQLDKPNGTAYANAQIYIDLRAVNDSMLYVGDTTIAADGSREILATANASGLMSLDLWANELFTNDSSYYHVTARDSKSRRIIQNFRCRVPDADTTVWIQNLTRW